MENLSLLSDTELTAFLLTVLAMIGGVIGLVYLVYWMVQNTLAENRWAAERREAKRVEQDRVAREDREYRADIQDMGLAMADVDLPREALVARIAAASQLHRQVIEGFAGGDRCRQ